MKNQDKTIALKINSELLEKITLKAKAEDRTISSMIRIALMEYIKNHQETN